MLPAVLQPLTTSITTSSTYLYDKISALPPSTVDLASKVHFFLNLTNSFLEKCFGESLPTPSAGPNPFLYASLSKQNAIYLMKPIPKEITDLKAFNKWAGDPNNWIEKSKMKTDENVEHNKMLKNHAHYNKRYLAGVITIAISSFLISQVASRFISSQDTWSKLGKKAFNIISFQVINWIAYKNMQSDRERQIIPVNFKDYVILPSLKKLAFFGALLGATAYISQRSPLSALSWKKPVTLF